MNGYRKPVGHRPYITRTGNPVGPLAGLCAVIILGALVVLSLLALDRAAATPAAHPAPTYLQPVDDQDHGALVAGVDR